MPDQIMSEVDLRSQLGRVRGRGSARSGTHHWWMQRITSAALLPLTLWFALSAASHVGASHAEAVAWISLPVNAILLLAMIGIGFHHTAAGLQVIFEDYVHKEWQRMAVILLIKAMCWLLALTAAFAVLRIAV